MGGWAVVGVIIVIAVVSAISQMLKNQQEQAPRRRINPAGNRGEPVRGGSNDIDRFLQELDKLRKKQSGAPSGRTEDASSSSPPVVKPKPKPKAKPVATPVPVKKAKSVAQPYRSKKSEEALLAEIAQASPIYDPTAIAGSITTPDRVQSAPSGIEKPPRPEPKTLFARDLLGLLSKGEAIPMAIVLSEVLGPPKCKKG